MNIIIKDAIYIKTSNQKIIDTLKSKLVKSNPQYYKMQRIGKYVVELPKEYIMYEETKDGHLKIPRGCGQLLKDLSKFYDDKFESVIDQRSIGHSIDVDINYNSKFKKIHDHQQGLIDLINKERKVNGTIVMPCGAGKTITALGLIAELKTSTLILVHTSDLLTQWKDEIMGCKDKDITAKLKGNFTYGQLGCGIKKVGDITIGTIQTINKLKDEDFDYLSRQFGLVIQDETQHTPSNTFLNTIKRLYSKRIYGLSATPERKDKLEFLLYNYIGPIIYEISDKHLKDCGKFVPVEIEYINTNCEFNFTQMQEDWTKLMAAMSRHSIRNELILSHAELDIKAGHFPMILCNRVLHASLLKQKLSSRGYKVGLLSGEVSKKARDEYKARALAGDLDALVCIDKIAGEGLDIPIINMVYLTYLINNKNMIKQIIGRGSRVYNGKKLCNVKIFKDFIYSENEIRTNITKLKRKQEHQINNVVYRNHRKWFKQFGYTIK